MSPESKAPSTNEVSPSNVFVRRSLKEGQDPSTQGIEVWDITNERKDGKVVAMNPVPVGEVVVVPQDGRPSYVEKQYEHKPLAPEQTSADAQHQLAREYSGLPLRGDKVLAKVDGTVKEVTVGEYYDYSDGRTGKYAGVTDAFSKEVGVNPSDFSAERQEALSREKAYADLAMTAFEASAEKLKALGRMTPVELIASLPEEKRARDKIELDSYATAFDMSDESGKMFREQALGRMSEDARKIASRYSELVTKENNK